MFNILLPADAGTNPLIHNYNIPQHVVDEIKALWGDRPPLPAGGLDITLSLPEWTGIGDYKQWGPVVGYIEKAFRLAGVLDAQPAGLNLRLREGGTVHQAEVALFQIMHADGTPFVLPKKGEQPCAAAC